MMEAPSTAIVSAALVTFSVTDRERRVLQLQRLTALGRLRLFKAIGPILSQNTPYLGMALLAASVVAIDDIPVPACVTEAQLEGVVARLGDAGIAAVAAGLAAGEAQELDRTDLGN